MPPTEVGVPYNSPTNGVHVTLRFVLPPSQRGVCYTKSRSTPISYDDRGQFGCAGRVKGVIIVSSSGNGAKPSKSSAQVATELRERLESRLGRDRTDAIWRDPANIEQVVEGEGEAAAVAEIILKAWRDLPEDAATPSRRGSGFRRGLRLALVAAFGVWALSLLRKARGTQDDGHPA